MYKLPSIGNRVRRFDILRRLIKKLLSDDYTYDIPEFIHNRFATKVNKHRIPYEVVITMLIELWLADSSDIRLKYLNLKTEQIKRRVAKRKYLIINNTEVYYDDFKVYPFVKPKKGIYEVHVDYYQRGIKVAGSIEFDLNEL